MDDVQSVVGAAAAPLVPWITRFGADPDSWNLDEGDEDDDGPSDGSNMPGLAMVAETLATYQRIMTAPVGQQELATLFNLPLSMVVDAMSVWGDPCAAGGEVHHHEFRNMLSSWVAMRGDEPPVSLAAATFMCPVEQIIAIVEDGHWLYLSGDRDGPQYALTIGLEGE